MQRTFDRIDFNLLKVLMILLEERSVTQAAERLFVTQSAMSKTLRRLRELFEDPLLVRQGGGLVPTPLAERLTDRLREFVTRAEGCFDLKAFDPAAASGIIHIAAPEQLALGVIPGLLNRLRDKAPLLALDSEHLPEDFHHLLASGSADFVIAGTPSDKPGLSDRLIYTAPAMCWHRRGHPLAASASITLADICNYPLISIKGHFPDRDIVAVRDKIRAAGAYPRVVLSTSHMGVAITTLQQCDFLTIAPDFLSWLPMAASALEAKPIGHIDAFSRFHADLYLIQHRRTLNSPLHQWLSDEIVSILTCPRSHVEANGPGQ